MFQMNQHAPFLNSDITRNNPSCFLFLIDQSSSMASRFGWTNAEPVPGVPDGIPKSEAVANALNNLLRNLIITCSKNDGVRNYFDVGVIGYGATVGPLWSGALTGHEMVPIADVAERYSRVIETRVTETDAQGRTYSHPVTYPVWVEPVAHGNTPMCAALRYAYDILNGWTIRNQTAHPPVVVHITDGEATDGDPAPAMASLTGLATSGGPVILFNIHLSSSRDARPTSFPDTAEGLPNAYARMLFNEASFLSPHMRKVAWDNAMPLSETAKAFVLNADATLLVTRAGNWDAPRRGLVGNAVQIAFHATLPKRDEPDDTCEDIIEFAEEANTLRVAVADGASDGLFAREWAALLAAQYAAHAERGKATDRQPLPAG